MDELRRPPVWLWPNLLSLDAPIVAVVWQDFVARSFSSTLLPAGRVVLALTVWAIYLADRIFDVRHPASEDEATRHQLYRRHNAAARWLLAGVLAADVLVSLFWLRPAVFSAGVVIGVVVVCYLSIFALWRVGGAAWKQPSAAIVFTAGVFLIGWMGSGQRQSLVIPAIAFALLCYRNMRLIERWPERAGSALRGVWWALAFAGLCSIWAIVSGSNWLHAVALSAVGLAAIDLFSGKLSRDARGVLADAVLLTPLLFR